MTELRKMKELFLIAALAVTFNAQADPMDFGKTNSGTYMDIGGGIVVGPNGTSYMDLGGGITSGSDGSTSMDLGGGISTHTDSDGNVGTCIDIGGGIISCTK